MQWIQQLQLGFKSGVFFSVVAEDGDAPLLHSIEWAQGPEQGSPPEHQHPVGALKGHVCPESLLEVLQTLIVLGELSMEPALHVRKVWTTTEE